MRILTYYTIDGDPLGSCTSRCYDAPSSRTRCNCVCGGMNHGKGRTVALANAHLLAQKAKFGASTHPDTRQMLLFDLEEHGKTSD